MKWSVSLLPPFQLLFFECLAAPTPLRSLPSSAHLSQTRMDSECLLGAEHLDTKTIDTESRSLRLLHAESCMNYYTERTAEAIEKANECKDELLKARQGWFQKFTSRKYLINLKSRMLSWLDVAKGFRQLRQIFSKAVGDLSGTSPGPVRIYPSHSYAAQHVGAQNEPHLYHLDSPRVPVQSVCA